MTATEMLIYMVGEQRAIYVLEGLYFSSLNALRRIREFYEMGVVETFPGFQNILLMLLSLFQ